MLFECSICGEKKECRFYKCYEFVNGKWFYLGEELICSSCLAVQQKVGPVVSADE